MKNKSLKKFFAVFLSVAMSLSLYVTPVFAETTEEAVAENVQTEVEAQENVVDEESVGDAATELPEAEENVKMTPVSGDYGTLHWEIDANGILTISGDGDYSCDYYDGIHNVPAWCQYASQIKTAVVTAKNLTSTEYMFYDCSSLTGLDVSNFDTSNVTSMSCMFEGCSNLTSLNLSNFNTSNVTSMSCMFEECSNLTSLDVSSFDTSNVISMSGMFNACSSLTSLDVSNFNTESVKTMYYMFNSCSSLTSLDISNFNTDNLLNLDSVDNMFSWCFGMKWIKAPKNLKYPVFLPGCRTGGDQIKMVIWENENGTGCNAMFSSATIVTYTKVDDGVPGKPTPNPTPDQPNNNNNTANTVNPQGTKVASYQGNNFYQDGNGKMRCYDGNGNMVKNNFKCDGTYTYYFQNDGTAMTDRLTYHPDGEHVIYFDENGHEVFNNFTHVKKSISGEAVDDLCFFDVYGHMYVDFITYDQAGVNLYYANPYGVMEHNGWFQFSDGNIGYANSDGTLMTNQFSYDQFGRKVYFQGDGKLARGLISDGTTYYQMDENDGHCTGEFPVQ